jgi:imidazole glycerol-phosphate synthase subunit HisF
MGNQAAVACINYTDPFHALRASKQAARSGAGEIILQCIPLDGMMEGYDLQTAREVFSVVDVPVVISCGAGTYDHLREGMEVADAVGAGAMWAFTDATPKEAKKYLREKGVKVRI